MDSNHSLVKTIFYTGLALLAFAANSVLCRLALGAGAIDASSFTVIRLLSGVITLLVIIKMANHKTSSPIQKGSWFASLMLFLYATAFSFAYITLDTATGALILFGSVQITMVLLSLISGSRLHITEWLGVLIAFAGFVYLMFPEMTTPSVSGFLLMTMAGIAWGGYTLKGRGTNNPLMDTGYNFFRTIPLVLILLVITVKNANYSSEGILLAVLSGGIASGMGYTVWYLALRGLTATQSAVVQLLVPVIAALGGVIFISEKITLRLIFSASIILGGIFLVILGRYKFSSK